MAGNSDGVRKAWEKRRAEKNKPKTSVLKSGMSLLDIATRNKVSVSELIKANNITSEDQIVEGLEITIPSQQSD